MYDRRDFEFALPNVDVTGRCCIQLCYIVCVFLCRRNAKKTTRQKKYQKHSGLERSPTSVTHLFAAAGDVHRPLREHKTDRRCSLLLVVALDRFGKQQERKNGSKLTAETEVSEQKASRAGTSTRRNQRTEGQGKSLNTPTTKRETTPPSSCRTNNKGFDMIIPTPAKLFARRKRSPHFPHRAGFLQTHRLRPPSTILLNF